MHFAFENDDYVYLHPTTAADFEFLHLGFRTQGVSCRVVDVEMEIDLVIRSRSRIDLPGYLSGTGM